MSGPICGLMRPRSLFIYSFIHLLILLMTNLFQQLKEYICNKVEKDMIMNKINNHRLHRILPNRRSTKQVLRLAKRISRVYHFDDYSGFVLSSFACFRHSIVSMYYSDLIPESLTTLSIILLLSRA